MAVLYKTPQAPVTPLPSGVTSGQSGEFVLCHFSHAEDLLFGITALQSLHIPILEVYTPVYIEGLKSKLRLQKLKIGYAVLKYGCLGGASLSAIIGYSLNRNWDAPLTGSNEINLVLTLLFMTVAFIFLSWALTIKPPKIIKLPATDYRFSIVVKTRHIIPGEGVASFLEYSGSVEISQAIKRRLAPRNIN